MNITEDLQNNILDYYDHFIAFIPRLTFGILTLLIFLLVAKIIRKKSIQFIQEKAENPLMVQFLNNFFAILNVVLGTLLFLYIIGLSGLAASLLGAASISAIVIGFAFRDIGENFIAGVILAFNSPFRIKDYVTTANVEGTIVALRLRDTHIKTSDGKDVYVPNANILKNPLFNNTIDGFLRKSFRIGVDYAADVNRAQEIILKNLKNIKGVQDEKSPQTFIQSLGSSTINIEARYWINTFDNSISSLDVQSNAFKTCLQELEKAGIQMPGDILELKNYNTEPLLSISYSNN
ncbi:MAG: mechanosensitive ion channel [Maribacter sp.]|nr:mechanosensitive ion channel [Maribacter sp.]